MKIAKCGRRKLAHQAEAARKHRRRKAGWHGYHDARAALIRGGRHSHAAREKIAEGPQALEADLEANFGDIVLAARQRGDIVLAARQRGDIVLAARQRGDIVWPRASRSLASSKRAWIRNWCGVKPNSASNRRMKWNVDIPASRAMAGIDKRCSRTWRSRSRAWHRRPKASCANSICSSVQTTFRDTDLARPRSLPRSHSCEDLFNKFRAFTRV